MKCEEFFQKHSFYPFLGILGCSSLLLEQNRENLGSSVLKYAPKLHLNVFQCGADWCRNNLNLIIFLNVMDVMDMIEVMEVMGVIRVMGVMHCEKWGT